MSGRGKILLVEDDLQVQINNKGILEHYGYDVFLAMDLAEARKAVREQTPDAVVLDISLPDGDGVDFLKELRGTMQIPVLVLTASQTAKKATASFDAGGDDYLRKPYDLKEFRARVDALMRRAAHVPEQIRKDRFSLHATSGVAFLDDKDLGLTRKEFALLFTFIQNPERFLGAEYLYEKAWKAPMLSNSGALRKTMSTLRVKIKDSGWAISWSNGEGYIFMRE
ncbi:MAG: response regulator transcription factor [Clostridiales bacterium]|jgi:DNA-binding response OmpR family regulator|nr:response regulator transcription factor [Clostridiales bacterium]